MVDVIDKANADYERWLSEKTKSKSHRPMTSSSAWIVGMILAKNAKLLCRPHSVVLPVKPTGSKNDE